MKRIFKFLFFLSLVLTLNLPAWARDPGQPSPSGANDPFGFYPDTAEGLHDFLQSIVASIKQNKALLNQHLNESLNQRLVVPNSRKWFARVYTAAVAREMANSYRSTSPDLVTELDQPDLDVRSEIKVTRVEFSDLQAAASSGIHFFSGMKTLVPVYTAYLTDPQNRRIRPIHLIFVYVQEGFRVIDGRFGKIDVQRRPTCGVPPVLEHLLLDSVPVDNQIMQSKLIRPALLPPSPEIDSARVPGTVVLFVVVGCDGTVLAADYLSGPTSAYKPAANNVRKWRYQRTYLNGNPVQVTTTVSTSVGADSMEH